MPMWSYGGGGPWYGFGWIFPLVGLVFMIVMVVACFRIMGSGMGRQTGLTGGEMEELRREIRELREEIRRLRERS